MSKDIQTPHLSLNVRFSKVDKRNRAENKSKVQLYEDEDLLKQSCTDHRCHKATAKRRHFGATAVILGVLHLLILAGIYTRYILATLDKQTVMTEKDQLNISLNQAQTRIINLTAERDELQTRYDNLNKSYSGSQLQLRSCMEDLRRWKTYPWFNRPRNG